MSPFPLYDTFERKTLSILQKYEENNVGVKVFHGVEYSYVIFDLKKNIFTRMFKKKVLKFFSSKVLKRLFGSQIILQLECVFDLQKIFFGIIKFSK